MEGAVLTLRLGALLREEAVGLVEEVLLKGRGPDVEVLVDAWGLHIVSLSAEGVPDTVGGLKKDLWTQAPVAGLEGGGSLEET